ncbi:alkaline phosphatase family protein [Rhodopseudomonas sp. P2A-2r]|uniref:alkaline phosphatase family protein n=1 Tax=unclassified Rhodopseudomonas TaxID=2638247 RepID=UPI002233E881|nr:alkaline phosphatase family protein [Rhodopseudomonas sp. P2A-2r]UZE49317.1 alkaline phosphatase family protein [Rhodopseudomonas sp. P2A-2r]
MRRAIIVTLDGLRPDMISPETTPNLVAFAEQAERFSDYRTVFPSCTRVVCSSLATGCHPARHGLQGNSVALMEDGQLVLRDAGDPDFLQHKRRVTGQSLAMPTLAERLKDDGGVIIFSNVSPGAAYAHDPDGYGHVYHRAGSFGPGRVPVSADDALDATPDLAGDRRMTERFIEQVLHTARPALGILWLCEPDHMQHESPLGSPEHLAVLAQADIHAGLVIDAVARLRAAGDDILLLIGSDHGHQTVTGVIDIDAELIGAGLKADPTSGDVMAVSNGTAALIYVHPDHAAATPRIHQFLMSREWAGQVIGPQDLGDVGQAAMASLAFAVSMRSDDAPNAFGIPGSSLAAKPAMGKPDRLGCGQHGGLAAWEQTPFLFASGAGFAPGATRPGQARIIDIAPTVLAYLGIAADGMDGQALQHDADIHTQGAA